MDGDKRGDLSVFREVEVALIRAIGMKRLVAVSLLSAAASVVWMTADLGAASVAAFTVSMFLLVATIDAALEVAVLVEASVPDPWSDPESVWNSAAALLELAASGADDAPSRVAEILGRGPPGDGDRRGGSGEERHDPDGIAGNSGVLDELLGVDGSGD